MAKLANRIKSSRVLNSGTSSGVKKAWETRRRGGGEGVETLEASVAPGVFVDKSIAGHIRRLNASGFKTFGSHSGALADHPGGKISDMSAPYLMFDHPTPTQLGKIKAAAQHLGLTVNDPESGWPYAQVNFDKGSDRSMVGKFDELTKRLIGYKISNSTSFPKSIFNISSALLRAKASPKMIRAGLLAVLGAGTGAPMYGVDEDEDLGELLKGTPPARMPGLLANSALGRWRDSLAKGLSSVVLAAKTPRIGLPEAGNGILENASVPHKGLGVVPTPKHRHRLRAGVDKPPTDAQKEAGNYRKRKLLWNGLDLRIENEANSVRSGIGPDGPWAVTMPCAYGYIVRTTQNAK